MCGNSETARTEGGSSVRELDFGYVKSLWPREGSIQSISILVVSISILEACRIHFCNLEEPKRRKNNVELFSEECRQGRTTQKSKSPSPWRSGAHEPLDYF